MGKTLQQQTLLKAMREKEPLSENGCTAVVPIHKHVNVDQIISLLTSQITDELRQEPYHTIHIDVAYEVSYIYTVQLTFP